eukprot:scaffold502_cov115-Isochrysis_galbana.AAC.9
MRHRHRRLDAAPPGEGHVARGHGTLTASERSNDLNAAGISSNNATLKWPLSLARCIAAAPKAKHRSGSANGALTGRFGGLGTEGHLEGLEIGWLCRTAPVPTRDVAAPTGRELEGSSQGERCISGSVEDATTEEVGCGSTVSERTHASRQWRCGREGASRDKAYVGERGRGGGRRGGEAAWQGEGGRQVC